MLLKLQAREHRILRVVQYKHLSDWYLTINVWECHGQTKVVSFVINKCGGKKTIGVKFEVKVKK